MTKAPFTLTEAQQSLVARHEPIVALPDITLPAADNGGVALDPGFTEIQNRAPVKGLGQDLLPMFGVNRIQVQELQELYEEIGPNKETVHKPVNDKFNQIRFVGNVFSQIDARGVRIIFQSVDDFVEVTFYGTGINVLYVGGLGGDDGRVRVDGGAESANIIPSTAAATGARNYNTNNIVNMATGLSQGLHTVKLRHEAGTLTIHGFEILNEVDDLTLPPGVAYIGGNKVEKTSTDTTPYDSDFENESGTDEDRGAHVLVYIDENGLVKKDVQWVPAEASSLSFGGGGFTGNEADHSDEEKTAEHFWREFGAELGSDFSTLVNSGSERAFTLDDNITNLTADNAATNTFIDGVENLTANTNFIRFTFVGTGLDIVGGANGQPSWDVTIDDTAIGNITTDGDSDTKLIRIVSGLPYGTHVVKFNRNASAFGLQKFIVYGPKTPDLPTGAAPLCDYFLMADFVANTGTNADDISDGVLRKHVLRESNLLGSTWAVGSPFAEQIGGEHISQSNNGSSLDQTFFGTGVHHRFATNSGHTAIIVVELNSGSGFVTVNESNFTINGSGAGPAITVTAHGGSFNTVSGNLSQVSGSRLEGSGLIIEGLALGTYTLRQINAQNVFAEFHSFDIITPIHAPKLNGPFTRQNTSRVGSQAIRDLRSFGSDCCTPSPAYSAVGVVTEPVTAALIDKPNGDTQVVFESDGKTPQTIIWSGTVRSVAGAGSGVFSSFKLFVDGKFVGPQRFQTANTVTSFAQNITLHYTSVFSKGTHSVLLHWGSGTNWALRVTDRIMTVT